MFIKAISLMGTTGISGEVVLSTESFLERSFDLSLTPSLSW